MTRYQMRPRIVEAVQNFDKQGIRKICDSYGQDTIEVGGILHIWLVNGWTCIDIGNWLIRHPNGTFSVETDQAFRENYEEVKE